MKIVFLSNFYNHHQSHFSETVFKLTKGQYLFVETQVMDEEHRALGYDDSNKPPYVLHLSEENRAYIEEQIELADVVIYGDAPHALIKNRIRAGKLVLVYTERWYKRELRWWLWPYLLLRHHSLYGRYKSLYLLCASAFSSSDCAKTFLFKNKAYKWGYFPETKRYDSIEKTIENKEPDSLLWVGRLLDWKHPELAVSVAEKLKKEGYRFHLNMIGIGEKMSELADMIEQKGLNDCVTLLGSMPPEQVRSHMERSQIFLFTSDFNEGWGAVLNEAMNSGCAVVASSGIGSVPYLLKDGENGVIYKNGDFDALYRKVKELYLNPEKRERLGAAAYKTLCETWNAEAAAERLMLLTEDLTRDGTSDRYDNGPCSKAEIRKNDWYKQ